MFDYSLVHWATFCVAAALLNLSPGPDMAFILGSALRGGRRAGFSALYGVWSGTFVHVAAAAAGLSAILSTSATAFSLIKWIGAAYLVWLGLQALRSRGAKASVARHGLPTKPSRLYVQGVLVSALNPKVALFFLAFLPQFVVAGAGPLWAQLLLHGTLVIAVAALIEPPLILLSEKVARASWVDSKIGQWADRCLGVFFISLGVRLAIGAR